MEQHNYQGALQQPIGSGFHAKSTSTEVIKGIDLTGKIAIVTGGNTGIGLETTKTLAQSGGTVIVPLLQSCLASLIPYFEMQDNFPKDIASLKITEAISILRIIDKDIDSVLANFDDPYKVNLISFMEKNYMFNMPLAKFSYLTGRSLTTFKRDFAKAFNTTPQRWLIKLPRIAPREFTSVTSS